MTLAGWNTPLNHGFQKNQVWEHMWEPFNLPTHKLLNISML